MCSCLSGKNILARYTFKISDVNQYVDDNGDRLCFVQGNLSL